ncbi:MAG TPA: serine/threonine-protein kinase [Kofleriaceae bacterium]
MVTASIPSRPPILITGQIVDDRYRILGVLAEGGMGTVFLAEHVLIGRRAAIKVLHRELAHDTSMVKRFMNEALAAGTLGHPNIVEATDMGFTPDRVPYIVYEYLEGSLLSEEVYRVSGLPIRRALRIAIQVASALEAAHNAGIVHLDLKSDNVFLTDKDGTLDHVKVLDFGISRFMEADCETTQRGLVMGTPEFMAPEQVTSPDTVDKRADIYALGVLIYEMISARRPYGGDDPRILLYRICNEAPPPLDREVAPELEQMLFGRLLAKNRDHRFSSMKEVIAALESMLQIVPRTGDSFAALAPAKPKPTSEDDGEYETEYEYEYEPEYKDEYKTESRIESRTELAVEPAADDHDEVIVSRPRRSGMGAVWVVLALMLAMAGGAVYLVADRIAASTNAVARAALEADADHIAAVLTAQARAARARTDELAAAPTLRAAIESDAAAISGLVRDNAAFWPKAGEALELYQLRDDRLTSVVRRPEGARSVAPGSGTSIESRADGVWVVAHAQIARPSAGIGGTVSVATPVDFAEIKRRLAEDAVDARLLGLGSAIELARTPGAPAGKQVTISLPPLPELDTRELTLQATIAPVTRGAEFRQASYACFGVAGLLLLGAIAGRVRRRRLVLEEL